MQKKRWLVGVFATLGGAFLAPGASLAAAFGISPPWITNNVLKTDSHFVYVIDLSTNDPKEEQVVTAKITGDPSVLRWVTLKNQDSLVMPVGQQHVPLYVQVDVPKGAKPGSYNGNIALTVAPKVRSSAQVPVLLGGIVSIQLKVVEHDVKDFWVKSIAAQPMAEGQPLTLAIQAKNLGNIPLSQIDTRVQVLDYKTGRFIASINDGKLSRPIYPQTLESAQLRFSTPSLPAGRYWLQVEALKDGKAVYQNKLYHEVVASKINTSVQTAVQVVEKAPVSFQNSALADTLALNSQTVNLETRVTVREPFDPAPYLPLAALVAAFAGGLAVWSMFRKPAKARPHRRHR